MPNGNALSLCWMLAIAGLWIAVPAAAQDAGLRSIPANTARDLGTYDCTAFADLGGHASPDCRTITDYSGMVYDPTNRRALVWGGGHAATYRDDVEAFDLSTLRWAPDTPPTPCDEMIFENVDMALARWVTSNHPISRHSYDLLVVVPPRRELWMLAKMQGRGHGCAMLPPVDEDAGIPYVLGQGRFAAYSFDDKTWRFTDVPSVGFQTGAEYDPVSGRILLVSHWGIRWFDPDTGNLEEIASFDPAVPGMDTGDGLQLVYHQALDRFYVVMTSPRRPGGGGIWEIRLNREHPEETTLERLAVELPEPRPGGLDGWVYDEVNELIVGGVIDGEVYAFDPSSLNWYRQTAIVDSSEGATIGTLVSKAIIYDAVDGVVVFRARTRGPGGGEHTWAYRWGGEPPPLEPPPDGGLRDGGTADGGASDAGRSDASGTDSGPTTEPGTDAATAPPDEMTGHGGCGCVVYGGPTGVSGNLLWIVASAALQMRRRRRA